MSLPLSVYMITLNNAATIEKALVSVHGWVDEIIVVDSDSTDGTAEIARKIHGQLPPAHDNQSAGQVSARAGPVLVFVVLFIDADEWLTPEIKAEIERFLREGTEYTVFWWSGRIFTWARSYVTADVSGSRDQALQEGQRQMGRRAPCKGCG